MNKDDANRTMDEMFHNSLLGATTNASRDFDPSRYQSMRKLKIKKYQLNSVVDKSVQAAGDETFPGFLLPSIKN